MKTPVLYFCFLPFGLIGVFSLINLLDPRPDLWHVLAVSWFAASPGIMALTILMAYADGWRDCRNSEE